MHYNAYFTSKPDTLMGDIEVCFKEHWDEFVKKISRRCVNYADAEDVVAEAFKRAILYKSSYNPNKQAMHIWIFSIVLNAYHDYIADLFKKGMSVSVSDEHIEGYERDFEGIATAEQVAKIIDVMSAGPTKDTLVMYFGLGMTPREIALVYPVNAKFVRNNVYRFKEFVVEKLSMGDWVANKNRIAS